MHPYLLTLHTKGTRSLKYWKANSQVLLITPSPSPPPQTTHTHHSSFILLPCHHERGPLLEHAKQCQHSHQDKIGAGMSRNIGRTQLHPGLIPRPLIAHRMVWEWDPTLTNRKSNLTPNSTYNHCNQVNFTHSTWRKRRWSFGEYSDLCHEWPNYLA